MKHSSKGGRSFERERVRTAIDLALLMVLFFLARHLLHGQFGFYEDDYTLVVRGMASSWAEVSAYVLDLAERFAHQGRPLQHGPVMLFGHLAGAMGGRIAAYWLGYAIVGINIGLAYWLFRRLLGGQFALVGGLAYALFSADTTQAFLYHTFGLQPALTFLLLGLHAYLSDRRLLAHLLALGALVSYESVYPVFAAAPLLEIRWDRAWRRRVVGHAVVIAAALVAAAVLRAAAGEGRVQELGAAELVLTPLYHALVGPLVALGSSLLRPLQALLDLDPLIALLSLAAAIAIAKAMWTLRGDVEAARSGDGIVRSLKHALRLDKGAADAQTNGFKRLIRLTFAGITMLALAYALTFTIRPYAISGRDSRVHFAAVLGFALVWAAVTGLALLLARRSAVRKMIVGLVALLFGLHVGFGLIVQRDYARAWDLQQRFWSSVVAYVPDVSDGTVIFVEPSGLQDTQYIGANTWYLPLVFQYVYQFPQEWEEAPRVYRLAPTWRTRVFTNPAELKTIDFRYQQITVPLENLVFLETEAGEVVRRLQSLEASGERISLPWDGLRGEPAFPLGLLYGELIGAAR